MRASMPIPLVLIALCACRTAPELSELRGVHAMRTGEMIRNASIERAIVSQHTLYPYHFVPSSAHLNAVGRRDLWVLVRHFAHAAGEVNLSRGDADDALYLARSQTLATELRSAGIAANRVNVVEGRPGGEGISGARLVKILEAPSGALGAAPRAGGANTGSSASMSQEQQQ